MGRNSKYPKSAGIYKLTCMVNDKIYIGKSVNLRRRLNDHRTGASGCSTILTNAIKKHGWDSFTVEILETFEVIDNTELLKLESDYIKSYNSTNRDIGYNFCEYSTDRTGIPHTEETKEKLRLANIGKTHSNETKQLLSDQFSGENHPMYGKHYDKDKLESRSGENSCWYGKTGERHPTFGRTHTEEAREKIKEKRAKQDISYLKKPIVQIDLSTGKEIQIWDCSVTAAEALGIAPKTIRDVANNRKHCKSAGGFGWKYKDPHHC